MEAARRLISTQHKEKYVRETLKDGIAPLGGGVCISAAVQCSLDDYLVGML